MTTEGLSVGRRRPPPDPATSSSPRPNQQRAVAAAFCHATRLARHSIQASQPTAEKQTAVVPSHAAVASPAAAAVCIWTMPRGFVLLPRTDKPTPLQHTFTTNRKQEPALRKPNKTRGTHDKTLGWVVGSIQDRTNTSTHQGLRVTSYQNQIRPDDNSKNSLPSVEQIMP